VGGTEEDKRVTVENANLKRGFFYMTLASFAVDNPTSKEAEIPKKVSRRERKEHKREAMRDMKILCDQVRETAYDIHLYQGHGHLEKVYENALAHRLRKAGLDVKQVSPHGV
jgi:hypothetical protein